MSGEELLYPITLHPDSPAMDQPHLGESLLDRGLEVCIDDVRHVARGERVEIEAVLDGDLDWCVRVDRLRFVFG